MRKTESLTILIILFLLSYSTHLLAQVETAQISVNVKDSSGNPLKGLQVTIINIGTGYSRSGITSERGVCHFYALPPGRYEVKIEAAEYYPEKQQIQIMVGQTAVLDFTMTHTQAEHYEVEVVAKAPIFEIKKTDVSSVVRTEQIDTLPLDSRNILNLASITPGMKYYSTSGQTLPSAGAVSSYNYLNLYVDGADWKSQFNGNIVGNGQTCSPIPELSVQEFRVILNTYDAEFSRGGSFIISAVTSRGSNEFHGTSFLTFENKDMTAKTRFQTEVPKYHREQAGISLSGPIIKEKLFFSLSYEYYNALNFKDVNPGRPAYNPDLWIKYKGTFDSPDARHVGALNVTYQPTGKDIFSLTFTSRYTYSKFYFGGTVAYDAGIFGKYTVNSLLLKNTHIFTDNALNEFSLQYLRWRHDEPCITEGPAYVYPSIRLGRGDFPIKLNEDHFKLIDKFTYIHGSHITKAGIEIANIKSEPWFPLYADGEFYFQTDVSELPYRALIGVGRYHPFTKEDAKGKTNGYSLAAFVQDGWNPNSRLTLNFGLRWEGEINMLNNNFKVPWLNEPDIINNIDSKYLNNADRKNQMLNFCPRFSMNYDLLGNGETVLRIGAGRSVDRILGYLGYYEWLYAAWGIYEIYNPGTKDPSLLRQKVLSGEGSATPSIYLLSKDMKLPRVDQFSIGISQKINENLIISADFINKYHSKLPVNIIANYYKPSIKRRTITNKFGNIYLYDSSGKARYHGMLFNLTYYRGKNFMQLSYTLSWTYSEGSSYRLKEHFRMLPSPGDERHRFVLNWGLRLPLNIQLSGIATLASPSSFSINIGQDINDTGTYTDDWPSDEKRTMTPDWKKIDNWYKMLDVRISKFIFVNNFKIGLLAEAYNLFNWFNGYGYIGRMADEKGNPILNFGQPTQAYQPRTIQLGLRCEF